MEKAEKALIVYLGAGAVGLLVGAYWLRLVEHWEPGYLLAHYCFGLGFPMLWVGLMSVKKQPSTKRWHVFLDRHVTKYLNWLFRYVDDGFWFGVFVTEVWSLWNEIVVYAVYNPRHGADWHHWVADFFGIVTAYSVCNLFSYQERMKQSVATC